MPHIDSNIPRNIFYSAIKMRFLRIARGTFFLDFFSPISKKLLNNMESQSQIKLALPKFILLHKQYF